MPNFRVFRAIAPLVLFAFRVLGAESGGSYAVYVSDERANDVAIIDGATHRVTARIAVGKRPRGIHLSPDGTRLYVAVSGSPILAPGAHAERAESAAPDKQADGIVTIDTSTRRVLGKLSVGSDPEQFALSRDGRIAYVSNEDESAASAWDLSSGREVFRAKVSDEPEGVAVHPLRDEVYVTCEERGDVFILGANDGSELGHFTVHGRPRSVAFLPDGSRAYVPAEGMGEVTVFDATAHRVLRTIKLEGKDVLPMCAVVAPDGRELYVSTGRGNTVAVIDPGEDRVVAQIPVGTRPWGIALSPDGQALYAANGKSDDVSVIDVRRRKETSRIKTGAGPWGVAIGPAQLR